MQASDGSTAPDTKAILDAAAQFLWSTEMSAQTDAFVERHANTFVGATVDGEQQLEWQHIYLEYTQMYESALESFVAEAHTTLAQFVGACRDALDNSAWQEHRGLATYILSAAEYDYFLRMMATAAADAMEPPAAYGDDVNRVVVLDDEPAAAAGDDLDGDFM